MLGWLGVVRLFALHVALWRVSPNNVCRSIFRSSLAHPDMGRTVPHALRFRHGQLKRSGTAGKREETHCSGRSLEAFPLQSSRRCTSSLHPTRR